MPHLNAQPFVPFNHLSLNPKLIGISEYKENQISVTENAVLWSRGTVLHKSVTFETKVKDACLCRFKEAQNMGDCLCVLLDTTLQFYASNGDSMTIPIPFRIKRLWQIDDYILLERDKRPEEESGPALLSLLHPLEWCKPVAVVISHDNSPNISLDDSFFDEDDVEFLEDPEVTIVHVNKFVVAYSASRKKHMIYHVSVQRKEIFEEYRSFVETSFIDTSLCLNESSIIESFTSPIKPVHHSDNIDLEKIESDVYLNRVRTKGNKEALRNKKAQAVVLVDSDPLSLVFLKDNEAFIYDFNISEDNQYEMIYWGSHKGVTSMSTTKLESGILGSTSEPHTALVTLSNHVCIYLHAKHELCRFSFGVVSSLSFGGGEYINVTSDRTYRVSLSIKSSSPLVNDVFQVLHKTIPTQLFSTLVYDFIESCQGKPIDEWLVLEDVFKRLSGFKAAPVQLKSAWDRLNTTKPFRSDIILRTDHRIFRKYLHVILLSLQVLYETFKLNVLKCSQTSKLQSTLYGMSQVLGWTKYIEHYDREFGPIHLDFTLLNNEVDLNIEASGFILSHRELYLTGKIVPSIYRWLHEVMIFEHIEQFPIIMGRCNDSRIICRFYWLLSGKKNDVYSLKASDFENRRPSPEQLVIVAMIQEGIHSVNDLSHTPFGVTIPLRETIAKCRNIPPLDHVEADQKIQVMKLLSRQDLLEKESHSLGVKTNLYHIDSELPQQDDTLKQSTKTKTLINLLFDDDRLTLARQQLDTSEPITIKRQTLNMSEDQVGSFDPTDSEANPEQQSILHKLKLKLLSLPIGRGMLTMATEYMQPTDRLLIKPVALSTRLKRGRGFIHIDLSNVFNPHNSWVQVQLSQGVGHDFTEQPWCEFHNGVAAGMALNKNLLTSDWILYNRSKKPCGEHAGLLLAIGIQGWLILSQTEVFSYLQQKHEQTSVAIMIGLSCTRRSTEDSYITRSLTLHVPSLVLDNNLDIPITFSCAAFVGLGLLFQSSASSFITEVLMCEMTKISMGDASMRECYSLCAGMGIGLTNLSRGTKHGAPPGLPELNVKLLRYMLGGGRLEGEFSHPSNKDNPKIQESEKLVNVDVTGPGACVALMLTYLKTMNNMVASKFSISNTKYLLSYTRPLMALLRVLGYNLIMWDNICPTIDWVVDQVPDLVMSAVCPDLNRSEISDNEDILDHLQSIYINIICGCCLSLGFRYAGSQSERATKLVRHFSNLFEQYKTIKNNPLPRSLCDQALLICILSQSCILSGSGDADLVETINKARQKFMHGSEQEDLGYGFHMSLSMSIGLTFLGSGRCSLKTTNDSIAYLVMSLYPRFPMNSNDNKYHLQAVRHLYALASEPRLLETRDVTTNEILKVKVEIVTDCEVLVRTAPCLLPEIFESINVIDPMYYNISVNNLNCRLIKVKKRALGVDLDKDVVNLLPVSTSETMRLCDILNVRLISTYYKYLDRNKHDRLFSCTVIEPLILKIEREIDTKWKRKEYLNHRKIDKDLMLFLNYYNVPDVELLGKVKSARELMNYMPFTPIRILNKIINS
ncbi:anaphase-promoting complex subunit Apc1 [Acrasis kona]|uniref:Anaphase-promoting complex subunit Apc1 n=1 Tax=Acrasis kona TaxID=1008807 RepID=A0AAW2ZMW3_9EUKA